ncbi:MAG TPA: DUF4231 domain-containing protein [Geminicoccaceae bacterium]|nr:DUF4231 domain-containing protein [Geminicoccaceae bacterium]
MGKAGGRPEKRAFAGPGLSLYQHVPEPQGPRRSALWRQLRRGGSRGRNLRPCWSGCKARSIGTTARPRPISGHTISKIPIIMLAILIPVLAEYGHVPGFEESRAFLVGVAAGIIVLLEGLQVLNKWQENWILYRATCEGLRNEQHLFAAKAGSYAGLKPEAAQRLLAERTSSLVMAEHGKWAKAHEHKIETTGSF